MNRNEVLTQLCAAALAAATALPAFAAGSPWDGTWKLNRSKSKTDGTVITLTATPDGTMHFSNGSLQYSFKCDGKDYPVLSDRTFSCTTSGKTIMDTSMKRGGGEVFSSSHRELSADGKSMTVVGKGKNPDGSTYTATTQFTRTAGTAGWAGSWKSTHTTSDNPDVLVLSLKGDTVHEEDPVFKFTVDAKLDGSDTAVRGLMPGLTYSFKSEGPNKIHFIEKINGKPLVEGDRTLSPDGKTITEENWIPNNPGGKQTFLYEKE